MKGYLIIKYRNGSLIKGEAELDSLTGEVITKISYSKEGIENESFELLYESFDICPVCHNYVMKTVIGDLANLSYGEYKICSDSSCVTE